jgi:hypothetical protein
MYQLRLPPCLLSELPYREPRCLICVHVPEHDFCAWQAPTVTASVQVIIARMRDRSIAASTAELVLRSGHNVALPIAPTEKELQLAVVAHINAFLESCGQRVSVDNDTQLSLLAAMEGTTGVLPQRGHAAFERGSERFQQSSFARAALDATHDALARFVPTPASAHNGTAKPPAAAHSASVEATTCAADDIGLDGHASKPSGFAPLPPHTAAAHGSRTRQPHAVLRRRPHSHPPCGGDLAA